jgi:prolyl-tRNA synthetase
MVVPSLFLTESLQVRWNQAFIYTLREEPAEAEVISHKLMLRAGMIQKLASGIYNYLPPGLRVVRKIEEIIRQEMAQSGAVELLMPGVIPAELWKESGRWDYYGPELLRLKDRKNNDFCLGPTHEEVIVDVVRRNIRSYRDLPLNLFQIQSKFRDEVRPRYGLMRGREFIMKDAYSFHTSEESLDETYWRMHAAYSTIFTRCGVEFRPVEADSGAIGGSVTHEFHVLADSGEDTIASCDSCDYAANIERAESRVLTPPQGLQCAEPTPIATPATTSIEALCALLNVPMTQTVKTLIYSVNHGEYLVAACIRGDLALNEVKLRAALGAEAVEIPDELLLKEQTGLPVGYLGPCALDRSAIKMVLADHSVALMNDAVCGANKLDTHLLHTLPSRDYQIDRYVSLSFVPQGDGCPRCEGTLRLCKGIEVGQVFKLGQKYARPMQLTYLDEAGEQQVATMGCYGIGVGRTAAAAIEQNHDDKGIVWPASIAPYKVTILCLDVDAQEAMQVALGLHDELEAAGIDVLLDDRQERPGVKFNDADLIGCTLRVTIGARGLKEGVVEIRPRATGQTTKVPVDGAAQAIRDFFASR